MQRIRIVAGEINLRGKSAKIIVFHSPKGGGTERFVGQAAKDAESGVEMLSCVRTKSVARMLEEIGGAAWDYTVNVKEGTILKVFVRLNPGGGKMERIANFYVRCRPGAAYRVVKMSTLIEDTLDVVIQLKDGLIEGNFDMLSVDEAIAEGVKCLPQHRSFADPIAVERIISSQTVLSEEKKAEPKKKIVSLLSPDTGEKIVFVTTKKKRSVNLG